ncbi:MAG: flagellar assembly protein FliW [Gemmatimonadales bacterium]
MAAVAPACAPACAPGSVFTNLFGQIDIHEDELLDFRDGLLGFSLCKRWLLIAGKKQGTAWLQSADHGSLAFMLIDPFLTFEGYTAHLGPTEIAQLDAEDPAQIAVFAIVTLPSADMPETTANLRGPVVINVKARLGAQVVASEGTWSVRQPLPQPALL